MNRFNKMNKIIALIRLSITALVLFKQIFYGTAATRCASFPNGVFENNFISIVGNPKSFVPRSIYSMKVQSSLPFTSFMITCESLHEDCSLQIMNDGLTTFAEDCLNTVVQINHREKNEINILWNAPTEGCIKLKAALLIQNNWKISEKKLCKLNTLYGDDPILSEKDECCSCDHAKYSLVFEGLWSKETHPKDFPGNEKAWLLHFSDLIGATHTSDYEMWAEGQYASYGLKQLAEYGIIREMELELRNVSTKLRSIIKAAGLWHPHVNSNITTLFRVDPKRHLLSVASMFGPTPDWFVGLSSFNLCTNDCNWIDSVTINLQPYDAGTKSGISYLSIGTPTEPPEKIYQIRSMYPEDPRGPFYNMYNDYIPPIAKIYIKKEKLFPKQCRDFLDTEILEQVSLSENTEDEMRKECAVKPYSHWSDCSVTCGIGLRKRQRSYKNKTSAKSSNCNRQLESIEMCVNDKKCPVDKDEIEEDIMPLNAPGDCDVTDWSEWSECSVTCGIGMITRSRSLTNYNMTKKCFHISLMEKNKCMKDPCTSLGIESSPDCPVTEWSNWSPCLSNCGKSHRERVRHFVSTNIKRYCTAVTQLRQVLQCKNKPCIKNKSSCFFNTEIGQCQGEFERWTYNKDKKSCEKFIYGGCRGNKNNFLTFEECYELCIQNEGNLTNSTASNTENNIQENQDVDCVVSKWGPWSKCHPCPNGERSKKRNILVHPSGRGRKCPVLVKTIKCSLTVEFCSYQ